MSVALCCRHASKPVFTGLSRIVGVSTTTLKRYPFSTVRSRPERREKPRVRWRRSSHQNLPQCSMRIVMGSMKELVATAPPPHAPDFTPPSGSPECLPAASRQSRFDERRRSPAARAVARRRIPCATTRTLTLARFPNFARRYSGPVLRGRYRRFGWYLSLLLRIRRAVLMSTSTTPLPRAPDLWVRSPPRTPLPSLSGVCLPARPLRYRREKHGTDRAGAQGFGRSLLSLPLCRRPVTSTSPNGALSSFPCGRLLFLLYIMCRGDCHGKKRRRHFVPPGTRFRRD